MFNFANGSLFYTLPISENLPSMSSLNWDSVDIATRLNKLNLNKSAEPDGIHPRVFYENPEILA